MKSVLVLMLLTAFSFGQDNPNLTHAISACGPLDTHFDAETSSSHETAQPVATKGVVYVVEEFRRAPGELGNPTIRVGVDGAWVGALRDKSYLFFSVDPGEHHLCSSWQSHLGRLSRLKAFTRVTVNAGKTYYFRALVTYATSGPISSSTMNLDLEPLDPDEGQFLVASYHLSDTRAKK